LHFGAFALKGGSTVGTVMPGGPSCASAAAKAAPSMPHATGNARCTIASAGRPLRLEIMMVPDADPLHRIA
jgi:hypothetical protein